MAGLYLILYILAMGIIGGIIGYITNVIAVEMLFRPEKPVCLLRRHLCLQGLVPARKESIAKRLAEITSRYALSGDVRQKYMRDLEEKVRQAIEEIVSNQFTGITTPLPITIPLISMVSRGIADALTPVALRLFEEASSRIDIAGIIEREFISLPSSEIERMFKQIAGKELRYIELLGLALGFLIGIAEGMFIVLTIL